MERVRIGILEDRSEGMVEEWKSQDGGIAHRNINRGFKKLRVWNDAIDLYALAYETFSKLPFELKKVAANAIDAAHSISRNIAEGYCRRSLKEYLNHLNFSLGSCGEFHSCYESFRRANQITDEEYRRIEELHYKVENGLLRLIRSLQRKQMDGDWQDNFEFEKAFGS
jgi:four helix bundle protein